MYHGGFNFALYDCVKLEAALESLFYFARYKITEKQTLKSPLIPAASRSFEHLQQVILTI